MDIMPTKLVKGQGLAKMLSESNHQALGINLSMLANEESEKEEEQQGLEMATQKIHVKYLTSPWYKEIVEYLLTLSCPMGCDKVKYRAVRMKSQKYVIANGQLYWRDPLGILLLCLTENEVQDIMTEFHEGLCGGHYRDRKSVV